MSDSPENGSSLSTVSAADDAKFGFSRPEMYSSKLSDSVDHYDRHLFLCYKTPESWPSKVEGSDSDPLPKLFASALKNFKADISVKTKLTICEGGEGSGFSDGDVLIFPEMIKYRYGYVKPEDVPSLLDQHIGKGEVIERLWRDASTDEKPGTAERSAKKGLGKLSCWPKTWEQSDILAAAAVVGAVATIVVAYNIYRSSFAIIGIAPDFAIMILFLHG
ncbi:hypothetical protein RJ641_022671 [Dillenia turbinata]|uniref:Uncharacterized protein n=1 Tax=Dillenia turbinata TaxID=194707 RepID=A0AAN8UCZ9_9MAGN